VRERLACGAHFSRKYLEHLERKQGIGLNERKEIGPTDKAYLRTRVCNCRKGIWLITKKGRQTQERTGLRWNGEDSPSIHGVHRQGRTTLMDDVDPCRRIGLAEKEPVRTARQYGRSRFKSANQIRVCDKCGGVGLHRRPQFSVCHGHNNSSIAGVANMIVSFFSEMSV
jgi:hypothetical protein